MRYNTEPSAGLEQVGRAVLMLDLGLHSSVEIKVNDLYVSSCFHCHTSCKIKHWEYCLSWRNSTAVVKETFTILALILLLHMVFEVLCIWTLTCNVCLHQVCVWSLEVSTSLQEQSTTDPTPLVIRWPTPVTMATAEASRVRAMGPGHRSQPAQVRTTSSIVYLFVALNYSALNCFPKWSTSFSRDQEKDPTSIVVW